MRGSRQQEEVSLEQKMRYLKEVENIYRLSKKVLPPAGKTWSQIADQHLQRALNLPVKEEAEPLRVRRGRMHHLHSPRTARLVERTLRNGVVHPDVLHHYRGDNVQSVRSDPLVFHPAPRMKADTPDVMHIVQHSDDLVYPDGHLQGYGFVPGTHDAVSHVPLEAAGPPEATVPSSAQGSYQ
jgi:hypothetical protein